MAMLHQMVEIIQAENRHDFVIVIVHFRSVNSKPLAPVGSTIHAQH